MKIQLLATSHGYSFINQAQALVTGLKMAGVTVIPETANCQEADIVIGVGSWRDYDLLVKKPLNKGAKRVIPWLVSDDKVDMYAEQLNSLERVLTTSEFCRKVMVRDGINPKLIEVLPEAVDDSFWYPLAKEKLELTIKLLTMSSIGVEIPEKLDLGKLKTTKVPIIFTTGGDATSKGALEVIEALGKIYRKTGNKRWLYMLKTWPYAGSLRRSAVELELAENLGIWENLRYLVGEFSQEFLRDLMNICDIYAAPSRGEGFGLPLVEAAMCGKPVVTCTGTAAEETVVQGESGFIARRDDIDDLAGYLEKLIVDKSLREKLGKRGREIAVEKYSPRVVGQKFLDIINE